MKNQKVCIVGLGYVGIPLLEELAKKTPLKKVVEPEDVALAIIGCITHLKTATGTRIVIDGGKNL